MRNDPRIDDLLDQWDDAREEGRSISVETLCRDCPELADEVRRQIRMVDRVDEVFDIRPQQRSSRDELAELPETLGRYRLDEQLGEGGFGQVWKGFDSKLERNVAIKVLKPERSRSVLQVDRFLSEARKVARLRHKNIVTVYETDHDGKWYFMVTEWINGRDLAKRLSVSRLPLEESVRIVAKVADALQHAHDQGVIHRDIKPHNILIDKDGEPFVTDFGIAVTESELLNDDSDTSGTPAYMAPEQASFVGPSVDPRTDVYSLGVVLYELLVGKVPYTATTLAMLRSNFQSRQIPSLSAENPDVSPELERVCLKAMAVDQNERWGSAKEFADQLRRLPPEPITERPSRRLAERSSPLATPSSRAYKWSKPFIGVLFSVAAVTIIFLFGKQIVGLGVLFVQGVYSDMDRSLRPTPVQVTYRESEDGRGMIAIIKNTSAKPLYNVRMVIHDAVVDPVIWDVAASQFDTVVAKVLNSDETIEVGDYFGGPIESGKYLGVGCDGYHAIAQELIP